MSTVGLPHSLPPSLPHGEIIRKAENLIWEFARLRHGCDNKIRQFFGLNFDLVFDEHIYPEWEVSIEEDCELGSDDNGKKVLAKTVVRMGKLCILIDRCLHPNRHDPRRTFTCWHELGHVILHGSWLKMQTLAGQQDSQLVTTEETIKPSNRTIDIMEQEANLFASHAAAPCWFVQMVVEQKFSLESPFRYIGPSTYCLVAEQRPYYRLCNSIADLCKNIAYLIQHRFGGLSIEALSYRVRDSGLIHDQSPAGQQ